LRSVACYLAGMCRKKNNISTATNKTVKKNIKSHNRGRVKKQPQQQQQQPQQHQKSHL